MEKLRTKLIIQEFYPFFQCCLRAANELVMAEAALNELMRKTRKKAMKQSESDRSLYLQNEIEMNAISAPVFGVITLEHFIHSYAVQRMNKRYKNVIEHIDNLDTESKWLVIPALTCSKEIDRSCPALNDLRQLIKARNAIVHPKPVIVNNFSEEQMVRTLERIENLAKQRRHIAKKAPQIVVSLINELLSVDKSRPLRRLVSEMKLQIRAAT